MPALVQQPHQCRCAGVASHRLGVAPNGVCLPGAVRARGVGLVQRRGTIRGEANDERGDAKRPHTTTLCVLLLHPSDEARQCVDTDGFVKRESVTLRLYACPVDQHARISRQTRKREADVFINGDDLPHSACVLQSRGRLALNTWWGDGDGMSARTSRWVSGWVVVGLVIGWCGAGKGPCARAARFDCGNHHVSRATQPRWGRLIARCVCACVGAQRV